MINLAAQLISIIFHPAVLSVITPALLIIFIPRDVPYSLYWIFYPLFFVIVVSLFTLYGIKKKLFSDFDVTKRKERGPFYAFVIILTVIYVSILLLLNGPKSLVILGIGVLIGAIILEIINRKLKASVHVAAVAAFMCTLALLFGGLFLLLPILIPIVAWSRIHMNRHTLSEAVIGGIIGTSITLILFLVIEYILYLYG